MLEGNFLIKRSLIPTGTNEEEVINTVQIIIYSFRLAKSANMDPGFLLSPRHQDTLHWYGGHPSYTAKSRYGFLSFGGILVSQFPQLWKAGIPLKIRAFLWLVLHLRF